VEEQDIVTSPPPANQGLRPSGTSTKRYMLISSSGGVLLDLLALRPWWSARDVRWVAVRADDTEQVLADLPVTWVPELRPGRPGAVLRAVLGARRRLRDEPVDAVLSAGSGVAVPWFVAARWCGIPTLWVETFNVIGRPGLAARLCARLATAVVVQHPHLLARHRRAVYIGELY
jgi:Oligosaccharide biosynthesis protein Alg14 like